MKKKNLNNGKLFEKNGLQSFPVVQWFHFLCRSSCVKKDLKKIDIWDKSAQVKYVAKFIKHNLYSKSSL